MRHLILAVVLLSACETMPSSGNPFEPVAVEAPVASTGGAEAETDGGDAEAPATTDPRFEKFDNTFKISSEELVGGAAPDSGEEGETPDAEAEGGDEDAVADAADADPMAAAYEALEQHEAQQAAAAQASTTLSMGGGFGGGGFGGWPLRLVSTVTDAQPPRAILGLPDGREVVVSPGTMVPEVGVVVMAVGRDQVEVARVQAKGDHATVSSQTLSSQF